MYQPLERRRFIRVLVESPVSFAAPDGTLGVGEMVNLSIRGLSFVAKERIEVSSSLRLSFSVGREMTFELGGKVRHCIGKSVWKYYGVQFSIMDYKELKQHIQLNDFIMLARRRQDDWFENRYRKRRLAPPKA